MLSRRDTSSSGRDIIYLPVKKKNTFTRQNDKLNILLVKT